MFPKPTQRMLQHNRLFDETTDVEGGGCFPLYRYTGC
jgi:hypothetical protein